MSKELWTIEANDKLKGIFSSKLRAINEIKRWYSGERSRQFKIVTDIEEIDTRDSQSCYICIHVDGKRYVYLYVSNALYNNGAMLVTI